MSEPSIPSGSPASETRYAVVSCDVLPEVFLKVMEVKRLLACGDEKSSASACKRADISRSAFYKYRDSVFTYEEKLTGRTVSLYARLSPQMQRKRAHPQPERAH